MCEPNGKCPQGGKSSRVCSTIKSEYRCSIYTERVEFGETVENNGDAKNMRITYNGTFQVIRSNRFHVPETENSLLEQDKVFFISYQKRT